MHVFTCDLVYMFVCVSVLVCMRVIVSVWVLYVFVYACVYICVCVQAVMRTVHDAKRDRCCSQREVRISMSSS